MSLLTACSQGRSKALPDIKTYSEKEQLQAAEELKESCKLGKILCEFMKDFKVMRDQTKVLKK
jgi:hypothetical protein